MNPPYRKKQIIPLDIADLAFGGRGIARENDYVWFVDGGIPGQRVMARVYHIRKQYGEARAVETLRPSPDEVEPACPHFGVCGGCQLQHLRYESQVEAKSRQVEDILIRLGGFKDVRVHRTLPASEIYGYRNKMEFTFSDQRWIPENDASGKPADFALGLHVPGRFDKVLDIDRCPLQSDRANGVLRSVQELVRGTDLPPYGSRSHRGVWRFLVLREGRNTGDLMVHFITSGQEPEKTREAVDGMAEALVGRHPAVTTITHSMTDRLSQVAYGENERILKGAGKIRETLLGRTFEISSGSFFQTHTHQAERLFGCIADLAEFSGTESVYDLYCGAGAIGLSIAHRVKAVTGVEAVEPAVRDALRNARINGITNVVFAAADMKHALRDVKFRSEAGPPDVVILDPPRGGTHPDTVEDLLSLGAPKIIYVSCNPPLFARDAKILCRDAYELGTVQPVDMFPHTGHVEIVAVLRRRNG